MIHQAKILQSACYEILANKFTNLHLHILPIYPPPATQAVPQAMGLSIDFPKKTFLHIPVYLLWSMDGDAHTQQALRYPCALILITLQLVSRWMHDVLRPSSRGYAFQDHLVVIKSLDKFLGSDCSGYNVINLFATGNLNLFLRRLVFTVCSHRKGLKNMMVLIFSA